jgi:predicted nucleotidyltransferase
VINTLDGVLDTLRSHEGELRDLGVSHAAVFGSVARGEAKGTSDVDVLVDLDDKALEIYTEKEREAVRAEVGVAPSVILRLTLSLHVLDEACDAAKMLVLHILGRFEGVVDERSGEGGIWNAKEIHTGKAGVEFLHCYRNH